MAEKNTANAMEWTKQHDVLLCREVLAVELYTKKKGSNERGKLWTDIAQSLRQSKDLKCKSTLSQRAVRERFALLQTKFKEKERDEMRASGISPEQDELDILLEEISEREKTYKDKQDVDGKQNRVDKIHAEDIRMKALERMGETKKRKVMQDEDAKPLKNRRRSGSDTVEFMKEKCDRELEIRQRELEVRNKEQKDRAEQMDAFRKQQENLLQFMQQQQTQQREQVQSFQVFMAQQQKQQHDTMLALLGNIYKQK